MKRVEATIPLLSLETENAHLSQFADAGPERGRELTSELQRSET